MLSTVGLSAVSIRSSLSECVSRQKSTDGVTGQKLQFENGTQTYFEDLPSRDLVVKDYFVVQKSKPQRTRRNYGENAKSV